MCAKVNEVRALGSGTGSLAVAIEAVVLFLLTAGQWRYGLARRRRGALQQDFVECRLPAARGRHRVGLLAYAERCILISPDLGSLNGPIGRVRIVAPASQQCAPQAPALTTEKRREEPYDHWRRRHSAARR